jgi:hypothetical protein
MKMKSVMAGEYTAPPVHGPAMTLIWGSAAGVVDADDGDPVTQRQLLHLDDLLRGDLAQRTPENGGVIGVDGDRPAIDLTETCHHTVARDPPLFHAESMCPMRGKNIELDKRPFIEQHLDAITCGCLAGGASLVRGFGFGVQRLVTALPVLVDLLLGDCGRLSFGRFNSLEARSRSPNWC